MPQNVIDLVAECICNDRNRGISQGGSLSPSLLNVYLDRHLDRVWRRKSREGTLLRYADDICICCSDKASANQAYDRLEATILPTGMQLKGNRQEAIRDLREEGTTANLLGYTVSRSNGTTAVTIGKEAWTKLDTNLKRCHEYTQSAARAIQTMKSFVNHAGPALRFTNTAELSERIGAIAAKHAFEETLTPGEIQTILGKALQRFDRLLRKATARLHAEYGGVS